MVTVVAAYETRNISNTLHCNYVKVNNITLLNLNIPTIFESRIYKALINMVMYNSNICDKFNL